MKQIAAMPGVTATATVCDNLALYGGGPDRDDLDKGLHPTLIYKPLITNSKILAETSRRGHSSNTLERTRMTNRTMSYAPSSRQRDKVSICAAAIAATIITYTSARGADFDLEIDPESGLVLLQDIHLSHDFREHVQQLELGTKFDSTSWLDDAMRQAEAERIALDGSTHRLHPEDWERDRIDEITRMRLSTQQWESPETSILHPPELSRSAGVSEKMGEVLGPYVTGAVVAAIPLPSISGRAFVGAVGVHTLGDIGAAGGSAYGRFIDITGHNALMPGLPEMANSPLPHKSVAESIGDAFRKLFQQPPRGVDRDLGIDPESELVVLHGIRVTHDAREHAAQVELGPRFDSTDWLDDAARRAEADRLTLEKTPDRLLPEDWEGGQSDDTSTMRQPTQPRDLPETSLLQSQEPNRNAGFSEKIGGALGPYATRAAVVGPIPKASMHVRALLGAAAVHTLGDIGAAGGRKYGRFIDMTGHNVLLPGLPERTNSARPDESVAESIGNAFRKLLR
ncbi:MAG: hypothetical protein OXI22_03910 [Defluviicoccus sp.]|nr:hypothetical protein [Defluviicoccus sp.]